MSEFVKHDSEKVRLDLIPQEVVWGLGHVLTYGAKKYTTAGSDGANNWALGAKWSRYWGALLRHLFAWLRGERFDPESGLPHLHHALACLTFLVVYEARGLGENDLFVEEDDSSEHKPQISTDSNSEASRDVEGGSNSSGGGPDCGEGLALAPTGQVSAAGAAREDDSGKDRVAGHLTQEHTGSVCPDSGGENDRPWKAPDLWQPPWVQRDG